MGPTIKKQFFLFNQTAFGVASNSKYKVAFFYRNYLLVRTKIKNKT
jgi:hypothetical protein